MVSRSRRETPSGKVSWTLGRAPQPWGSPTESWAFQSQNRHSQKHPHTVSCGRERTEGQQGQPHRDKTSHCRSPQWVCCQSPPQPAQCPGEQMGAGGIVCPRAHRSAPRGRGVVTIAAGVACFLRGLGAPLRRLCCAPPPLPPAGTHPGLSPTWHRGMWLVSPPYAPPTWVRLHQEANRVASGGPGSGSLSVAVPACTVGEEQED